MKLFGHRIMLKPIDLDMAKMLAINPLEFFTLYEIPLDHDWPSVALQALLPMYSERLVQDPSEIGYGPWLILHKETNEILGEIGFKGKSSNHVVDIGYQIVPRMRRIGYASEAVYVLCNWAFDQGIVMITASCDKFNYNSQRVLFHNNFLLVRQEYDLLYYHKRRDING
ncbi:GNAT family N-acetyltransferase [Radiobacillus sp. PE A8.2]|uniref:GNAT family N-acetyltransferase n=1 Tax=Radiobacillus sp. PE A8.2 TaxID=3380349 RepID=UPI00388F8D13